MRAYFVVMALSSVAFGEQPPESMTKLTVRLESPGVPEGSFPAKPKLMYRAGNSYCRTEELPDPEHGIHGLMILNEPDAWMVNLLTKTAQHFVDRGPTFNCHLAIFRGEQVKSTADMKDPLLELEFGQELGYFKGKGGTPKKGPVLQDKPTTVYALASEIRNCSCSRRERRSDRGLLPGSVAIPTRSSGMGLTSSSRSTRSFSLSRKA